jgi:hypothetical protein
VCKEKFKYCSHKQIFIHSQLTSNLNMQLHIIIAAYGKAVATAGLLNSLIVQTNKSWVTYVVHDGPPAPDFAELKNVIKDPRIGFYNSARQFGCYGHINRKMTLETINGGPNDFVLITNCDNYYIPIFVERMLGEAKHDVGIVYCDTLHSHQGYAVQSSALKLSYIDMGAFIVRLDIAKENGFNHVDYPAADGLFAEECAARCASKNLWTVHINKVMFVHN